MADQKLRENPLLSIIFSFALPSIILTKMSTTEQLGPDKALVLALSFPVAYIFYDYFKRRDLSFISILGLIGILCTGLFTLFKLDAHWIAVKEATIPSLIGLGIWLSMRTSKPLVKQLIYNDNIMNVELIDQRLHAAHQKPAFEKLLVESSYLLVASSLFSAVLNYGLAKYLLLSPTGTPEFNAELGKMNALSWPIIALPSAAVSMYALFRLMKGIKKLTGLEMEEVLNAQAKK